MIEIDRHKLNKTSLWEESKVEINNKSELPRITLPLVCFGRVRKRLNVITENTKTITKQ
jgi:hypothetical protein